MLELPGLDYDTPPAKPDTPPAKPDTPPAKPDTPPAQPATPWTPRKSAARSVYSIGDIGPGGGIIFHKAGSRQPWGQYLEAAPTGWNGEREDPLVRWGFLDDVYADIPDARGKLIGDGRANTTAIIEWLTSRSLHPRPSSDSKANTAAIIEAGASPAAVMSRSQRRKERNWVRGIIEAGSSSVAGAMAHLYAGGQKTDWFLPSKLELNALYRERMIVGGFTEDTYWSSSQMNKRVAWYKSFTGEGFQKSGETSRRMRVRPVRAF